MADDLSARLRTKANSVEYDEWYDEEVVSLLCDAAEALEAAPPSERTLPLPLTTAEVHEVAAACAAVEPTHRGYVEVQLDLDTWAKFRAALSSDSGADPTGLSCPKCKAPNAECHEDADTHEHVCHACGYTQTFRGGNVVPDSGADPEPQRVIVDFAEVEPDPEPVQQHSPLRTWPADPEDGTDG